MLGNLILELARVPGKRGAARADQITAALARGQAKGIATGAALGVQTELLGRRRIVVGSWLGLVLLNLLFDLLGWRRRHILRGRWWRTDDRDVLHQPLRLLIFIGHEAM